MFPLTTREPVGRCVLHFVRTSCSFWLQTFMRLNCYEYGVCANFVDDTPLGLCFPNLRAPKFCVVIQFRITCNFFEDTSVRKYGLLAGWMNEWIRI